MAIVPTLLTPLILSITPASINVRTPSYDHASQGAEVVAQYQTSTTTINGTQTFDFQGRPNDADADKGRD
jgi:hypothetical protein